MRRKSEKKEEKNRYSISMFSPWFFWYKCRKCGYEYRRENIYEICIDYHTKCENGIQISGSKTTDLYYFCSNCYKDKKEVRAWFERVYLPNYKY